MDFISLLILAFLLEFLDNSIGGGFGTILSPLLIVFGYDPKVIVPAILVSETISGLWGGYWHIRFGNVNGKAVLATLAGSLISMALATYLIGVVLPSSTVKIFIGFIAILMGFLVMMRTFFKYKDSGDHIDLKKVPFLGAIIGFNKGGSGGGYGPLSVLGYMFLGMPAALAIGTTTIAEGIACFLGVIMYLEIIGIVLSIATALSIGSFLADPFSAWLNNRLKLKLKTKKHGQIIGVLMTVLGTISLLKTVGLI